MKNNDTHLAVFPSSWTPQQGTEECRNVIQVFKGTISYQKLSSPLAYLATQESWDSWVNLTKAVRVL